MIRLIGPSRHERVTATYSPLTVTHPPRSEQPIDGGMVVAAYTVIAAMVAVLLLGMSAIWTAL